METLDTVCEFRSVFVWDESEGAESEVIRLKGDGGRRSQKISEEMLAHINHDVACGGEYTKMETAFMAGQYYDNMIITEDEGDSKGSKATAVTTEDSCFSVFERSDHVKSNPFVQRAGRALRCTGGVDTHYTMQDMITNEELFFKLRRGEIPLIRGLQKVVDQDGVERLELQPMDDDSEYSKATSVMSSGSKNGGGGRFSCFGICNGFFCPEKKKKRSSWYDSALVVVSWKKKNDALDTLCNGSGTREKGTASS